MDHPDTIYKICTALAWADACARGAYEGSEADARDGFIHFSGARQIAETARRHFAGQYDLVLVAVKSAALGDALKWEQSRGGDLFPHLYAPLEVDRVESVADLPLGPDGHVFPPLKG